MPAYTRKIVYLSEAQRQELVANGTITVNGITVNYNENDIYITPQQSSMSIGTVTTLAPGADATASITGTAENAVLSLGIPQGLKGDTPNISIGTVSEWATAAASITGTAANPVLNLTLPNATVPTKVSQLQNDAGYGTYTKPTNGIPASDLEEVYLTQHQDISGKLNTSLKGAVNGLAELDANGHVPTSQLPSYVDDVIEGYLYNSKFYKENAHTTEISGETGKIYVDLSTEKTYRWSGSAFVEISASLALGTTSSTAYRGDYGAAAYAHGVTNKGSAFANGLYKITTNSEGHVTAASAVEKSDIIALGIPAQDTTYSSLSGEENGTTISLVTTGEKYNWNNKYTKPLNGIPSTDLVDTYIKTTDYAIANSNNFGIVKIDTLYGLATNTNNILTIKAATGTQIKAGTDDYGPVTSKKAYLAAFYGLAKAAGYDEKDEPTTNFGTYSSGAKAAIQTMLGIPTKISDLTDDSGHYTKPSGGIPAADLADTYLTSHQDISGKANISDLATVATTGSYNDLLNTPTIPTSVSDLVDDSGHYTLPSGGIPTTDLASGIVTSLGLANTAYQKPSNGIPATDIANGVIPDITYKAPIIINSITGTTVQLNDAIENTNLESVIVNIEPTQSGTGTPSPDNIRSISGYTEINVYMSPTQNTNDGTTYTMELPSTIYKGTINFTTGVLTVTHYLFSSTWGARSVISDTGSYKRGSFTLPYLSSAPNTTADPGYLCSVSGTWYYQYSHASNHYYTARYQGDDYLYLTLPNTTADSTVIQLLYQMETPLTYQLTAQQLITLQGVNNIWTNSGNITVEYKADTKKYIDQNEGVKDIQLNGTSILSNGIGNIPKADSTTYGIVKVNSLYGLDNSSNYLTIQRANGATIQSGTEQYKPIVPQTQQYSVFYGLAKAAGDTTQAATDIATTFGQYTETAKSKISTMLNAPITVSGTTPTITAMSGVQYICGEVSTLSIIAPESGCIDVIFTSGTTPTILTVTSAKANTTIKWMNQFNSTNLDANTVYEINILNGEYGVAGTWT